MTEAQVRWASHAKWLKEHHCSLRDGSDLSKLTSEERKERAKQIQFESRIVPTAMGNSKHGKLVRCQS